MYPPIALRKTKSSSAVLPILLAAYSALSSSSLSSSSEEDSSSNVISIPYKPSVAHASQRRWLGHVNHLSRLQHRSEAQRIVYEALNEREKEKRRRGEIIKKIMTALSVNPISMSVSAPPPQGLSFAYAPPQHSSLPPIQPPTAVPAHSIPTQLMTICSPAAQSNTLANNVSYLPSIYIQNGPLAVSQTLQVNSVGAELTNHSQEVKNILQQRMMTATSNLATRLLQPV